MVQNRLYIVDALRGFALGGIVLVHMVEQYIGARAPEDIEQLVYGSLADQAVGAFIGIFLTGKFFALFSFLFGLSFYLQMSRAEQRGESYGLRFIWRAILLMGFGMFHHMIYRGDILSIYAPLAILLVPFHKMSSKWVWVTIGIIFSGLWRVILALLVGDGSIFGGAAIDGSDGGLATYWSAFRNGTFTDVALSNLQEGFRSKMDFQYGVFYRGYLTFGYFLLGMMAGRLKLFESYIGYISKIKKYMWRGLGAFVLSALIGGGIFALHQSQHQEMDFGSPIVACALHFIALADVGMTVFILCLFLFLYNREGWLPRLRLFEPYGKMALTNYILQSIIGTFIFFNWGLGLMGQFSAWMLFLMALGVIAPQMFLSTLWLRKFRYGPLEWLWRSLTYGKWA